MHATPATGRSKESYRIALFALFALAIHLLACILTYRGLGDWDAVHYVRGALAWIENGPSLGRDHWELRYPLVLPMAASFELAGRSELSASLPNYVFGALLVLSSVIFAERHLGRYAGLFLGVLVATSSPLVLLPLEVEIRGPEVLFSALSIWLFLSGLSREGRHATLLLLSAGLLAGLAWMCREVAGYLLPLFVLSGWFLAKPEMRMRTMLLPSVGFASVIVFELVLYSLAAGDPLYRYITDLSHGRGNPGTEFAGSLSAAGPSFFAVLLEPLMQRFTNITTGAISMVGALAAVFLAFRWRQTAVKERRALVVFSLAAALSYALGTVLLNLEMPRYFPIIDYLVLVLIATAAAVFARRGHLLASSLVIAVAAASSVFVTDFQRDYEFDAYRTAAALARDGGQAVAAPHWVRERATLLLRLDGLSEEDASARFVAPSDAEPGAQGFMPGQDWLGPSDSFGQGWVRVGDGPPIAPSWSHRVLSVLTAPLPLPDRVREKLRPPPGVIYRLEEPGRVP